MGRFWGLLYCAGFSSLRFSLVGGDSRFYFMMDLGRVSGPLLSTVRADGRICWLDFGAKLRNLRGIESWRGRLLECLLLGVFLCGRLGNLCCRGLARNRGRG